MATRTEPLEHRTSKQGMISGAAPPPSAAAASSEIWEFVGPAGSELILGLLTDNELVGPGLEVVCELPGDAVSGSEDIYSRTRQLEGIDLRLAGVSTMIRSLRILKMNLKAGRYRELGACVDTGESRP